VGNFVHWVQKIYLSRQLLAKVLVIISDYIDRRKRVSTEMHTTETDEDEGPEREEGAG